MIEITNKKKLGNMEVFTVVTGGIEIADCKLMEGQKGQWVAGPSKKFTGKDGTEKWFSLVKFSNEVQQQIISALESEGPPPAVLPTVNTDDDIPF